jgi:hypothetical protein
MGGDSPEMGLDDAVAAVTLQGLPPSIHFPLQDKLTSVSKEPA